MFISLLILLVGHEFLSIHTINVTSFLIIIIFTILFAIIAMLLTYVVVYIFDCII